MHSNRKDRQSNQDQARKHLTSVLLIFASENQKKQTTRLASNTFFIFLSVTLSLSIGLTLFYRFKSNEKSSMIFSSSIFVQAEETRKSLEMISASKDHSATLIFLHGLGDTGGNWLNVFKMHQIPNSFGHVKFVFPTAPIRPVTLNNGMQMTSWFDVRGLDQNAEEDKEGILQASKSIEDLIDKEIENGILADRIIVAGFSMGGAVALHSALTSKHRLGGVVALSTWLPLSTTFPHALVSGKTKFDLPILQCHGENDRIVHLRWARQTEKSFKTMGFRSYEFKTYPNVAHSLGEEEIRDVVAFLRETLFKNHSEF